MIDGATPTRAQAAAFVAKAWGLRVLRALRDARNPARPRKHAMGDALRDAPILGESRASLWHDASADGALTAGKVQNLRVALRAFHRIEAPASQVWSFWKQLGRAGRARGFVAGRELREGCLVPSIGGGLCLLSNAIHDAALHAGLEIVERHRHSRVLPGSLAEIDRDATVFWNYVDLRLRASFAWRLEATMDADTLVMRIRGHGARPAATEPQRRAADRLDDCHTCDVATCHRSNMQLRALRRAWWIPGRAPQLAQHAEAGDRVLHSPMDAGWRRVEQSLRYRLARRRGHTLPAIAMAQAEREARVFASRLEAIDTHVVVPQSLLPFLWRDGVLAGRGFDVWMEALPMHAIQAALDGAAALHPDARSLRDFRAPADVVEAERAALAAARSWMTSHARVCAMAGTKARVIAWPMPKPIERAQRAGGRPRIFLAASPLARKGALEARAAVAALGGILVVPPGDSEPDFFDDGVERATSHLEGLRSADVAILPAFVEHQPRGLLTAIVSGIPVVASDACGLSADLPWKRVEPGDVEGLRAALAAVIPA